MFLLDNIILAPFRSLHWLAQEIQNAVTEELQNESQTIMEELRKLYLMLETNGITEAEFEVQEAQLLDRLDALQEQASSEDEENELSEPSI